MRELVWDEERMRDRVLAARGETLPALVLKNARVVNVFTEEIERGDVAIEDGCIVGVGSYRGRTEVELGNAYVCPGLIDGHIHLESSMIAPPEFERAVLPHGTTAVAADPHEIANGGGRSRD